MGSNNTTASPKAEKAQTKAPAATATSKSVPDAPFIDPVVNTANSFTSGPSSTKRSVPKEGGVADFFTESLNDYNKSQLEQVNTLNWSESFHGLGQGAFSREAQDILYAPIPENDVEITPDGLLYLPEIKYRRALNRSFGAGAWGLAPRSETRISKNDNGMGGLLTREYGLIVHGRLVSIARGEQTFFNPTGIPTATEGCKSNALMRCCKDLGIASELWDPRFIKKFKSAKCEQLFVEYIPTKKKKKIWKRKDEPVDYPFKA
ncbi:hypothetical protein CANARDRAFT_229494 [[Candida] arabinofermentans NRRL YB-2248]|uniref:Mitochondrial genome maintenance protein MGM101 n=1 Tax=[Candida] arabinofermentans NRRL YB-2248 TaxID=983967 RepID=A0A1E4T606_9ASCO|nr:hypothetical protein CANARDRAFT_229494 [[Candida] arabinofermentans NRRL YB-2248]